MPRSTILERLITDALSGRISQTETDVGTLFADTADMMRLSDDVSALNNDANYQTDAEVDATINALIDAAPGTLDTLGELATALQDNDSELAAIIAVNTSQNTAITDLESEVDLRVPRSVETTDPTAADIDYLVGHEWRNYTSGVVFKLIKNDEPSIGSVEVLPSSASSVEIGTLANSNSQFFDFSLQEIGSISKVSLLLLSTATAGTISAKIQHGRGAETETVQVAFAESASPQILEFDFVDFTASSGSCNFLFSADVGGVFVQRTTQLFPGKSTVINTVSDNTNGGVSIEIFSPSSPYWKSLNSLIQTASTVEFDNSASTLISTSVQDAIAELETITTQISENSDTVSAIARIVNPATTITLTNADIKSRHYIVNAETTISLPPSPVDGKHFLIKNSLASTENLIISSVTVLSGEMYEIHYDGTEWVEW